MFSKSEKLSLALLLFGLAMLVWGVKWSANYYGYNLAKYFANAIKNTLEFADKNYPENQPFISVGFKIGKNDDTLHIDRLNNRVYSDKNFVYYYRGYKVVCSVAYDVGSKLYLITCETK